jgi:hypothetical protein
MIHVGKDTRSRIVSKGISAGRSRNAYRGLVQVQPGAERARNFSQCDSMLIGDNAGANTYPYIQVCARVRTNVCMFACMHASMCCDDLQSSVWHLWLNACCFSHERAAPPSK